MARSVSILLFVLFASRASAQELPAWLQVRPRYLAYATPPLDDDARRARPRAAWMVAVGAGIAAGGAAYLLTQGDKNSCAYDERRIKGALPAGIALTAIGTVLATAGAIRMATLSKALRPGRLETGMMAMTAGLSFLTTWVVPVYANPDTIRCID